MEKKQILFIRGGETFDSTEAYHEYLRTVPLELQGSHKSWRDWIIWALSETHELITPLMPAKQNAEYEAWKIWFERHLPFLTDKSPIVIGHSLGTSFLLKWLTENKFPKKIQQLHLVASYVGDENPTGLERIATFGFDLTQLPNVMQSVTELHLWHSTDDPVVPYSNTEKVAAAIPEAIVHTFSDRKHFNQPAFTELLQELQK